MFTKVVSVVLMLGLVSRAEEEIKVCPDGTFQPEIGADCRPCSGCTDNQVVRETCSGRHDTVCGPFTEFQQFQPYHVEKEPATKLQTDVQTDSESSDPLYGVSVAMTVLLALTSTVCVAIGALICYKRLKEKKEGLMAQADKDSEQPSCSDWLENTNCRRRPPSVSTVNDVIETSNAPSTSKIQQFEIAEGPDTT